jgi:hypothetical protein
LEERLGPGAQIEPFVYDAAEPAGADLRCLGNCSSKEMPNFILSSRGQASQPMARRRKL